MTHPTSGPPSASDLRELLTQLRDESARLDDQPPPEDTVNPGYTAGYHDGWRLAVQLAEEQDKLPAPDDPTPLRELAEDLAENVRRVRNAQNAIPATHRGGMLDALEDVRGRAMVAARRAEAAEQERLRAAAAAEQERLHAVGSAAVPPDDDLSDWSGYPKTFPADAVVEDLTHLALFLGGDATSFTGHLLRLFAKADPGNLNKLVQVYPRQVRAWLLWRACAPVPARTLVALLEASNATEVRR